MRRLKFCEMEVYRRWSRRTPAVFRVFPPALRTREPAGSSLGGQTASPAWPLDCSEIHIPANSPEHPAYKCGYEGREQDAQTLKGFVAS